MLTRMKLIHSLLILMLTVLAACSPEQATEPVTPGQTAPGGYLRVLVKVASVSAATRAPSPGENGDGLEEGVRNENTIHDLCIFIYDDSQGEGLDAPGQTPFVFMGYVSELTVDNGTLSAVYPLLNYKPSESHRAVVVANAGDIRQNVSDLGSLRTRLAAGAWTEGSDISKASRFLMASAFNGAKTSNKEDGLIRLTNAGEGSASNPNYSVSVAVERVAARIDLMVSRAENIEKGNRESLHYDVKGTGSSLRITHVLPVNLMQSPSWMLKHVSVGEDISSLLVCGDETVAAGTPSNYVVAPTTSLKKTEVTEQTLAQWYGKSRVANIRANYPSLMDASAMMSNFIPYALSQNEDGYDTVITLAYSNENTQTKDCHLPQFMTGLLFRSIYHPAVIFTDIDLNSSLPESSEARDFWLVRPTDSKMDETDCIYFASLQLAQEYVAVHPEIQASITGYPGGVCYYNLWIRHALDNSIDDADAVHETHPMEYGIVRNNIYRIGLSFTGPGTPTPELTNPLNIKSRIFVRRWNFRPQPEILM